jgi:DNA invertase Pin-like site-specific DNA recombinase
MPTTAAAATRAIGIVRVSQRDDDSGHSPEVQVRAMLKQAQDEGFTLNLDDIWDENVDGNGHVRPASGGAALADRPKLRAAVEAIERGEAQVLLAERFDRFFRDLDVQREVIRRVESAGGRLATAAGNITHATAESELHANINGSIAQYNKRTAMERSHDAVEVAIRSGVVPWPRVTPGYVRGEDGRFYPDPEKAPIVAEAFELRATGFTVKEVRDFLADHGISISYNGMLSLLSSRVVLGEIHFGKYEPNLEAHEPIIERELWERVQRVKVSRGAYASSVRLLARVGVLRCASCGHAMIAGARVQSGRRYPYYRCHFVDCPARVVIAAEVAEDLVVAEVQRLLADLQGSATDTDSAAEAASSLERAQAAYDAGMAVLDPLEPAAVTRLGELRAARDQARERHEVAVANSSATTVAVTVGDWDKLNLQERRGLIRAVIESVVVTPGGRGAERITVTPR